MSWFTLPQKTFACIWMLLYQPLLIPHSFFSIFSLLIYFLGQQPCFSASICLSNNVTIYCIIVLYSHFMLSYSPRHYLKIVKTLSEKFLPEGKWEMQTVQPGYHEKAWRLESCHASPVWPPSGLRLTLRPHMLEKLMLVLSCHVCFQ